MGFEKYYEARDLIKDIMSKDLLGPVEENEIICGERPLDYYILGKLYTRDADASNVLGMSSDDCGELDEEDSISLCNGKNPSSFGISICLKENAKEIVVHVTAARYEKKTFEEVKELLQLEATDYNQKRDYWQRVVVAPLKITLSIDELVCGKAVVKTVEEGLNLKILNHRIMSDGSKIVTFTLTNEKCKCDDFRLESSNAYFQPCIEIFETETDSIGELAYKIGLNSEEEIIELNMLYHENKNFASGHGCAVKVDIEDGKKHISSDFFPEFEVKQMKPSTEFTGDILSMKYLSEAKADDVINGLYNLTEMYANWIEGLKQYAAKPEFEYKEAAERNISKCIETCKRIEKSIECLKDAKVLKAFQLANRAMFEQRKRMLIRTGKFHEDSSIRWYPFQLAFFVQEVCSFAEPNSAERKAVDLLWFPTGGGKTEAYLGIAAYVIFLRRLKQGSAGDGVTVLMRYTMRLLTFQQFERAAALICACEAIRREENIAGGEIGIGLWAGQALTPNRIEDADKILKGEDISSFGYEIGHPVQLRRCPHCGKTISEENYICDRQNSRMLIKCSSSECEFSEGLPIYLIDEEIYKHTPTYIVATIDKFAQIALKEECANLFGRNKACPPELIIQDELHLISGPLGTITGLYEAAISKLCTRNGVSAKVIASTATIRNAKEQILGLYASDFTQFPPQGLSINDSFFAVQSTRKERPARLYLGCMGIGTSPTTMMIRVMSSLLFATRYLSEQEEYDENVIDAYWTLTTYFNTLRELGGAIIRVVDDIQDRFLYLQNAKFDKKYPMQLKNQRYTKYKELTSREKSEDIGKVVQEELPIPYKKDGSTYPYDFVLSSNMISVGVDVGRLGSMVVVGQPKTTAEYIQATSRVGRENPGLVIATYNQAKSRDRSHYEQFGQYHASFYKHVEATSITPFADRARDRALQTLYVILCRYMIPSLFSDKDAVNYRSDMPELKEVRKYIYDYVLTVDPDELDNVKRELLQIEEEWEERCAHKEKFQYKRSKFISEDECLFDADFEEDSRFRVLNTMRSVETTITVKTKE